MEKIILAVVMIFIFLPYVNANSIVKQNLTCTVERKPFPENTVLKLFLMDRSLDIGIDLTDSSINPTDVRGGQYAFTGEKIMYTVLVREDNGAADIKTVRWVNKDESNAETLCEDVTPSEIDEEWISETTNLDWDSQTDKVYECVMEVQSGWSGEDEIYVEATDQQDEEGQTLSEMWTFNPPLEVSVETSDGEALRFGEVIKDQQVPGTTSPNCVIDMNENMDPNVGRDCPAYKSENLKEGEKLCDISFSENELKIKNVGGVVTLWPFIAGTDFHSSNGLAECPSDNTLSVNQFEYRALQGSWDSGWRVMPEYSDNFGCEGPFGDDTCRGGCRLTTGCPINVLAPGQSINVRLKVVWPTPCIGDFDEGSIYAIVRAV